MSTNAIAPSNSWLTQAQQVLGDIKSKILSSPDIIDVTKLGPPHPSKLEPDYKKHGFVYLKYLQHVLKTEDERMACGEAARTVGSELQESPMLAVSFFGRAECISVTQVAISRLLEFNPIMISLSSTQDPEELREHTLPEHNLFLLGVDRAKFMAVSGLGTGRPPRPIAQVFKALKKSPGGICDVFLNCVCPFSEYPKNAQPLAKYIESFGTLYLFEERSYSLRVKDTYAEGYKEASSIHKLAVEVLKQNDLVCTQRTDTGLQGMCNFLGRTLKADVLDPMVGMLAQIFSGIVWKPKFDPVKVEWAIWSKGAEDDLRPIAQELTALGYTVQANNVAQKEPNKVAKKTEEFAVILRDPFPERLHLQNTISMHYHRRIAMLITSYTAST